MAKSDQPSSTSAQSKPTSSPDKLVKTGTKKNSPELTDDELKRVSGGFIPVDGDKIT